MNAELLHDALNLLPGDLITAVDKVRNAPRKKKLPWLRYSAMAACFALILCGGMLLAPFFFGMGGSTESSMEFQSVNDSVAEAPMEQKPGAPESAEAQAPPAADAPKEFGAGSLWINAQTRYIQIPWQEEALCIDRKYPGTQLIRSRQELEDWCADWEGFYDMESFRESCKVYDDAFFAENDLLLAVVEESYDAVHHEVLGLTERNDGTWELTLRRLDVNRPMTEEPVPMCILMDVKKDVLRTEDTVNVVFAQ